MLNIMERKDQLIVALANLLNDSKTRPFLFRTRFERTMIKTQTLAKAMNDIDLEQQAIDALNKMKCIVDKSNSTSDGILRSFIVLEPDIRSLLSKIDQYGTVAVT